MKTRPLITCDVVRHAAVSAGRAREKGRCLRAALLKRKGRGAASHEAGKQHGKHTVKRTHASGVRKGVRWRARGEEREEERERERQTTATEQFSLSETQTAGGGARTPGS